MRQWARRGALACALAAVAAIAVPGPAVADGDTALVLTGITGTIEVTPGMCWPGAEATGCQGANQQNARVNLDTCQAHGVFEGQTVAGASCDATYTALMEGSAPGLQPSCLTSHTFSSDQATAFGTPVNEAVLAGITRASTVEYPARASGIIHATGWLDDDDPDTDPAGDHRMVLSLRVRPQNFPAACSTTPATLIDIQAATIVVK